MAKKNAAPVCQHEAVRRADGFLYCKCGAAFERARDVEWLKAAIAMQLDTKFFEERKTEFLAKAAKDLAFAIKRDGYSMMEEFMTASKKMRLAENFKAVESWPETLKGVRDAIESIKRDLLTAYAIRWDNSTSAFSNQFEKAEGCAKSNMLAVLDSVAKSIELYLRDASLPVI